MTKLTGSTATAALVHMLEDCQEKRGDLADTLERYGDHKEFCSGAPCVCGWRAEYRRLNLKPLHT